MKYEIKNRFSNEAQLTVDIDCASDASESMKLGLAIRKAIESRANLRGAYLGGAYLGGADLRDANLRDANLRDANLRGANLRGAYLGGADLRDANLRDANLRDANLRGANLRDANLRDANLRDANLRDANLRGANLRDANLRDANLRGANLRGAYLGGAYLGGADLKGVPVIKDIHQTVYAAASSEGGLDMDSWHTCETTHCRAGWVTTLASEGGAALEYALGTSYAASLIYMASDPELEKIPDFHCSNDEAMQDMKRLADLEAA